MSGKKKRIRLHRVLSLVVAIALTIVIAVVVFQRSGLLSFRLSAYINDHYLRGTPFHFSCGKITGDLVGHISLSRPVLHYQSGGRIFEVFRAERITMDYDLPKAVKLQVLVKNLQMDGVRVDLRRDHEGKLILPMLATPPGEARRSDDIPPIVVERFAMNDMKIAYEGKGDPIHLEKGLVLGKLQYIEGEAALEIEAASAAFEDLDLALHSLQLKGHWMRDELVIEDLKVTTDQSLVIANGRYQAGRLHHVQAVFNPLALKEVSALGILDDQTGEIGGNIVLDGVPDSLQVQGSVTGKALGLALSNLTLQGVVYPERIHLTSIDGALFGSRLNGDVTYDRRSGSYAFSGVCESLDISRGFVEDEDVPHTDLNGFIGVEYHAPQRRYEIKGDLRRSTIDGFESDAVQTHLEWSKADGLKINSATLSRPGIHIEGSGELAPGGAADLILALRGDSIDYLMDYLELPRIGGAGELRGRLVGPLDRFQLNLNGTWRDMAYEFGVIDTAVVHGDARDVGSDGMHATIDIQGRHLSLGNRRFNEPHLLIQASPGDVTVRDFSFAADSTMFFTSDFQIRPAEPSGETIVVNHFVVRTPYSDWVNDRPATVALRDGVVDLDTLVLRSIERELVISGVYDSEKRVIDADIRGRIDLPLVHDALALPLLLEGRGGFTAHVEGSVDNPSLDLSLELAQGRIDSLTFDRLGFDGGFDGERYRIDRLLVVDKTDSLRFSGSWDYTDSPVSVARNGWRKEVATVAPIDFTMKSYRYPLAAIFRAAHRRPLWGGSFDGEIHVTGTMTTPDVEISGSILPRPEDSFRLPPVSAGLAYRKGVLEIDRIAFDDGTTAGSITGRLPMRLGLGEAPAVPEDAPVDMTIDVASKDLTAVAGYVRVFAATRGTLSGKVHVGGTFGRPQYKGSVDLGQGALRIRGTSDVYKNVAAKLEASGNKITLASLSGEVGKKGRFTGTGTALVDRFHVQSYDVRVQLSDYTFTMIRDFESTQSGTLRIHTVPVVDVGPTPMITGQVQVQQAVITKPIGREDGSPSGAALPTESPAWLCNIDIDAPNNVWLRNPDLNMELGGKMIVRRDVQGLYFRGDMSVLRGSYTLYNNKFRIISGRIDFSQTGLRPSTTLNAYTPHRVAGQPEHRIFLDLTWPADKKEPTIALSYDSPGYSETDLWKMLGGQVVTGDPWLAGTGAVGAATGTAQHLASNYLERILSAQMRDVTVDVESRPVDQAGGTTNGQRELIIGVGRYLGEDLYLNYRQGLTLSSAREVDVEYRISNLLLLRSEIIRHQGPKGIPGKSRQSSDEINFDLKFRIEY
jgi:hypothetical protein